MRVLIILLFGLVLLAAIIFSGRYNVAASERKSDPFELLMGALAERSIKHHAKGVAAPPARPADLSEGALHFAATCELCHGAPGVERSAIGKGLHPQAPDLIEEAGEWGPAELFWIAKHGIRMTGMPAFGVTHSDEQLWAVTHFVQELPLMTAAEYREAVEAAGDEHDHEHLIGG